MKDENKFLSRSRDRERWKKKLTTQPKKEAKADAIYFRPTLSDDKRIRELAEMTGETKNSIVEKLVAASLYNKTFTTQKLEQQKMVLRRLEDKTGDVADNQLEIVRLLEDICREQKTADSFQTSLLSEIYCMSHTAVSLMRTALLQILGLARENAPTPQVLASFDETSNLTIERSLQDLGTACAHHQIKNGRVTGGNLFWKSKLRRSDSEPQTD
ncbi:MAG: hypothetical protein ACR2MD_05550 [Aridibacter sp.]